MTSGYSLPVWEEQVYGTGETSIEGIRQDLQKYVAACDARSADRNRRTRLPCQLQTQLGCAGDPDDNVTTICNHGWKLRFPSCMIAVG